MPETGQYYTRPREGFRFKFGGLKTNSVADSLPPGKYPFAQNIRTTSDESVRTRWGLIPLFPTSPGPISALRAYSALGTDNRPRLLACRPAGTVTQVWLDTPAAIGSLVGASSGASMVPFRPAESPNPWMYIANGSDYQKFSAPAPGVTQEKVGIAEPQPQCEAAISSYQESIISSNPAYAHGGVASAAVNQNRIVDTVQLVLPDPANPALNTVSVSDFSPLQVYTRWMVLDIGGNDYTVEDVFPYQPIPVGIAAIYYFTGTSGHCIVVPQNMSPGPGTEGQSLYTQNLLGNLRRGSLIQFALGDVAIVWSVTTGPDGTISFETSTTTQNFAGGSFTQLPAIQVLGTPTLGQPITAPNVGFNLSGAGIGTQTSTVALGPIFVTSLFSFQPDDYIHISFVINTLASLNEMKILFDVGDGTFTQNFYFYTLRVSDIEAAVQNTLTQLGAAQLVVQRATIDEENAAAARNQLATASGDQTTPGDNQWIDLIFPISALTRVGDQQSQTLQNVNAIQYLFNVNAATDASIGNTTVRGGYSPDVGTNGAPYQYRVRPRSSVTGAVGNPSPTPYYGVSPRREQVTVYLPSAAYDPQIDTWDVYRYGGTVTSYRWIGQAASTATTFIDNYTDDAALAGAVLEIDNLEPWPTIDAPLNATALVVGTVAVATVPTVGNLLRYLPGNLVRIGAINVYTLRRRPTLISGDTYLLELEENAGSQPAALIAIYEPQVANQLLPYMWGPDAAGTVFAVGDPLRPGTLYFAKNYAPDNAPDSYNIEITPPSTPLLGGEVLDGLSFVASTMEWWALYPQQNEAQRYSVVKQPMTRGLAAPFGHCNDGKSIYYWAKDGIWSSSAGSLTDADLANIFPHDGVAGANYVYNGQTVYAPDYAYASQFRLAHANGYLYADYVSSTAAGPPTPAFTDAATDLSTPAAWTVVGASVIANPGGPGGATVINTTPANRAFISTGLGSLAGTTITFWFYFPVNLFPVCDFFFGSNAAGAGVGIRLDGRGPGNVAASGFFTSTNFHTGGIGSGPTLTISSLVWHEVVVAVNAAGTAASWSLDGTAMETNVAHSLDGDFIGVFGDDADEGAYWADIQITAAVSPTVSLYHTLVLDLKRMAWSVDVLAGTAAATIHYQPEQQSGSLLSTGTEYPLLVAGTSTGEVVEEQDLSNDAGGPIPSIIYTNEWDGGDIRAGEQWGDLWMYLVPAAGAGGVLIQPIQQGLALGPPTVIPTSNAPVQTPVSLGGEVLANFLGIQVSWTDDYTRQPGPTIIRAWQPSFIPKPETIADRFTDWYDGGTEAAKYVQGFLLHADTFDVVKGLAVRDSDSLTTHAFTPAVEHDGESILAYSFVAPFICHQMRIEPTDQVPWRFWDVDWVFEPTSEAAETWMTQGTAFGLQGYMHVKQVSPCYAATQPITLTITSYDGQSPVPITLPATGGAMQKAAFMLTANKGQLYFFAATSPAPFQLFLENWEVEVGQWARQENYLRYRNLGDPTGDQARI